MVGLAEAHFAAARERATHATSVLGCAASPGLPAAPVDHADLGQQRRLMGMSLISIERSWSLSRKMPLCIVRRVVLVLRLGVNMRES